jgi:membrane-associated protease RseP (regulator of RpoE activity)
VTAVGIIAAIAVLLLSIMLHEAGHFLTAKHYGMKATRFFLGFGPTIWSTRRGETEYGIKAVPAGGFVKIVGMTPLEEVEPGDEERAFYKFPARERAVVLSAGSAVHIVLAFLITYLVLVFAGDLSSSRVSVTVDSIPKCVYTSVTQTKCHAGDPVSPSLNVLNPGDRIVSVNGTPVHDDNTLRDALKVGVPVHITVNRDGQQPALTVTPVAVNQKVDGAMQTVAKIGVLLTRNPDPPSVGAGAAVPKTFVTMGEFFTQTVKGLSRIPHTLSDVLQGKQRNVNDVGTVVEATRISGQISGAQGIPLAVKIGSFFLLMAGLNFFIGIFNMLPLLPLDGGHVAILTFERVRSGLARVLHRPDPGRVDILKVMPVTYAVFVALVGMSLILLYADIFRPINLNG